MPTVEELLGPVAASAQKEVQSRLHGFFGGMLRQFLPQIWVFRTERGVASLCVAADGSATVRSGAVEPADVTIEVGHDRLTSALTSRGRTSVPGPFAATPHTARGRTAFDYLRSRLGL
ncbi:MAG TPA: hypothetical protein VML94_00955 [Thermoplasmata archaeon]|nr:hypothetical protein [Thermoplasmata archaeon]